MRFMMIVKASRVSEADGMPTQEHTNEMMKYDEELVKAGVLVAAERLHPSSDVIRISFPVPGGKPQVLKGPFAEAKETIVGFTLIEVKLREEAIEWALRMPNPHGFGKGEIELYQVKETPDDFF